ncbi:MAG: MarR family winged helix-turn-helix transcriptional regulator [Ilumatobacter sp.]|jgi:DNA-binding MarR family transcriptional regulator|uniref:MarR family winged helix-turn-helix transcriptional regulator n=1 Tax=Ilumatobacter sp. TaxID=1967498 RepID=UPI00391D51B0
MSSNADANSHAVTDSVPPDAFESAAADRVRELGDDIDLTTFAAMFDLFRASSRIIGELEASVHRSVGLSTAGFRVLFTVWVFDALEPRRIATLSGVSRAAVSGVLNTLERDGFVRKRRDQADGRLVTVTLTDSGRATVAEAYRAQNRREREIFAGLDAAELERFTSTLRRLLAAPIEGFASHE